MLAIALHTRARPGFRTETLLLGGVLLVAVAAWLPALWNGLVQDDYVSVLLSGERWHLWNLRDYFAPIDPAARYLRPLPPLSMYLDDVLWGTSRAWAWHLPGVLLHGVNSALVAALLLPRSRFAALAAGLTFALHPLNTEPVGWISARPDLLMTTGLLASAVLFRRRLVAASVVAFACALLSKEAAVVFPALLTGWLLLRRRPLSGAAWHWVALGGYLLYRGAVLASAREWPGLTEDPAAWLAQPWAAMAFPLSEGVGWAKWPLAAVFALVAARVLMRGREVWPVAVATVIALVPLLPVYQLGPDFQFGRFLYWPLAGWALLVGLSLGGRPRWSTALLAVYLVALASAGVWPRAAFQEVGATAERVVREAAETTRDLPRDATVIATGAPVTRNGWVVFGGYFDIALDHARGRLGEPDRPRVIDTAWAAHTGRWAPLPGPGDIVIRWRGPSEGFADCSFAPRESGTAPCPELETVEAIDFGAEDLGRYRAEGFRWNETGRGVSWNWLTRPTARIVVRLDTSGDLMLRVRMMSAVDNAVTVRVNGVSAGTREIAGGFKWSEESYTLPVDAWTDGPYQIIGLEAATGNDGLFVALDRARFSPPGPGGDDAIAAGPVPGTVTR